MRKTILLAFVLVVLVAFLVQSSDAKKAPKNEKSGGEKSQGKKQEQQKSGKQEKGSNKKSKGKNAGKSKKGEETAQEESAVDSGKGKKEKKTKESAVDGTKNERSKNAKDQTVKSSKNLKGKKTEEKTNKEKVIPQKATKVDKKQREKKQKREVLPEEPEVIEEVVEEIVVGEEEKPAKKIKVQTGKAAKPQKPSKKAKKQKVVEEEVTAEEEALEIEGVEVEESTTCVKKTKAKAKPCSEAEVGQGEEETLLDVNPNSCTTNAECAHGSCCKRSKQTKINECQVLDLWEGEKCKSTCACTEGLICFAENLPETSTKSTKKSSGVCKIPAPDDSDLGTILN